MKTLTSNELADMNSETQNEQGLKSADVQTNLLTISNFEKHGFQTAGKYQEDQFVFKHTLHKIFQGVIADEEQEKRRKEMDTEISILNSDLEHKKDNIKHLKDESIPDIDEEISELEIEKFKLTKDPESNEEGDKISYVIGASISAFLTIYLVVTSRIITHYV